MDSSAYGYVPHRAEVRLASDSKDSNVKEQVQVGYFNHLRKNGRPVRAGFKSEVRIVPDGFEAGESDCFLIKVNVKNDGYLKLGMYGQVSWNK